MEQVIGTSSCSLLSNELSSFMELRWASIVPDVTSMGHFAAAMECDYTRAQQGLYLPTYGSSNFATITLFTDTEPAWINLIQKLI